MAPAPIIQLPVNRNSNQGNPTECNASYGQIFRGRIRRSIGQFMKNLRVPGAINDTHITDPVTHQTIKISVGILFTRLTVDGRDYYFNRFTGKFDGTGMGCG